MNYGIAATHLIPLMRIQTTRNRQGEYNSATYMGRLRWFWVRPIDERPYEFLCPQQIAEAYEIAPSPEPPLMGGWYVIGAFVDE